ncbi:MAG: hypothetical protein IH943_05845 [Acidobacteria bacterium]|nr:hypothetical protein [Acidobacteriota bacterium]
MRKKLTATVIAVFVFSLIAASAASLGGITAPTELGADEAVVAACTSGGVTVDFAATYQNGEYQVDDVTVSIDAADGSCNGETVRVVVSSTTVPWASTEVTGVIGSDSATLSFAGQALSAEETDYVDVAID